jgi:predicted nucleotidyltransferase
MLDLKERPLEAEESAIVPISAIINRLKRNINYASLPIIEKLPFILDFMLDNEFKQNIQKIYIFGSYAYGEPTEDSDIDFCVIIDDSISEYQNEVYFNIQKKLWRERIIPNDLLVYNAGSFDRYKNLRGIERVVIKYGELIYERK